MMQVKNKYFVLRRMGGWLAVAASFLLCCSIPATALGAESDHPLKPYDRSNPREALRSFLESSDALGEYLVVDYLPTPTRDEYYEILRLNERVLRGLDLSELPPAARKKIAQTAAGALYETLSRLELPAFDQIPGETQWGTVDGTNSAFWVIPDTEIVLVRSMSGSRQGQFLFSTETVSRAEEFYEKVHELPYTRSIPLEYMQEIIVNQGGWMIPSLWINALPPWFSLPVGGQTVWKWFALVLILGVFLLVLKLIYRLSQWSNGRHPFLQSLAHVTLPVYFLAGMPAMSYLILVQINLSGYVGSAIASSLSFVMFLAIAWLCWRMSPVVAEAIITSPKISSESINAHLIRLCSRLMGIIAVALSLAAGANRLGIPVYGIAAGLGIGGLSIALAAQSTIENLIGGLSLFGDKPIRIGDFCKYGSEIGTVETIGMRSTRLRGLDRKLTTIPNAALSKMPIINFDQRDRILIRSIIQVRLDTTPKQLRNLLGKLREMLLAHPRVLDDLMRVRFIGIGDSSLDIELYAYTSTQSWSEFLDIQEDVFLQVMEMVEQSGTRLAYPSQTLFWGRDEETIAGKSDQTTHEVMEGDER